MSTEVSRKLVHLIALLIPILYYIIPRRELSILLLGLFTLGFILIDYIRLHVGSIKRLFLLLFGQLLRRKELYTLTGGSYLLLASFVAIIIFPNRGVFIAAISFLVIGDTLAALFGLRFGRTRLFKKTLAGTIACLVSCLIISYIVYKLPNTNFPLIAGIIGSIVASIVEALPININDNVVIPISSGAIMQIITILIK
ncbi:MAG: phosphatidate cytidylyltransferase [candidate division WOR-3 bacterium]